MLKKLKTYFINDYIKIYDNSHHHKNNNNKKHLTILIVSNKFLKKKLLERHQKIYKLLWNQFKKKIYAISIHTYTINEWKMIKNNKIKNIKCYNKL